MIINHVRYFWVGVLVFIMLFGYVKNAVQFIATDFMPPYKAEIIRGVGVLIPPLGGIVGYIGIPDEPRIEIIKP